MKNKVNATTIKKANEVLRRSVNFTPLQHDLYLSKKYKANVYLKREDLQKVRSFKLRGAYFAMHETPKKQLENGVVCASAGNHAQGVAYTAHEMKVDAYIYMPTTTPKQKVDQVRFFGGNYANIILEGDTFDASAAAAKKFAKANAMKFIDPFDDPNVINGQGTVALETIDELERVGVSADYVFVPVGGGGLIAGVSTYFKAEMPDAKIVAVEPKGAASMAAAFAQGGPVELDEIDKFVDGAAVKKVGKLTYELARENVDSVMNVDEGQISSTIIELYTKNAIVVEPAGALSVAALEDVKAEIKGKTVVCVISGGNNDITRMTDIEERSLIFQGVKHYFLINFPQRPGALREFLNDVLGEDDDITRFEYLKKLNRSRGAALIGVQLKNPKDLKPLLKKLNKFDPTFINLQDNELLYSMLS
ncbi:MAG: threonine ammonia-lyase IlvA [Lactobacillales bacterium]|jgi:threonine dehydratase|nr:threonine ammonia-lyase IlvA [Lactobacillales bacterium]